MITAQIASIPSRRGMLKKVVESLRPQVDKLQVALNNYNSTPEFLRGCEVVHLDNSTGDAAKFYNVGNVKGYIFTCDDDIVYPQKYVKYMVSKVKQYRSIVTLHGRAYPRPFQCYRSGTNYHCIGTVKKDVKVDLGGTGVMAWHSDIIRVKYSDFKIRNMADVWMAKLAHEQKVSIICVAHNTGYLRYLNPIDTIWREQRKNNFAVQDSILKSFLL